MRAIPVAHNSKCAKRVENVGRDGMVFVAVQVFGKDGTHIGNVLRAGCRQYGFAPIVGRVVNHSGINETGAKFDRHGFGVNGCGHCGRNHVQIFVNLESHNSSGNPPGRGLNGPGFPGPGYLPNRHVLFVDSANEAMGVYVVQIFVGRKYRSVAGTDQLPIRVVDVVANVFNEIRCFRAVGGFNCCHNSFCFWSPEPAGSVGFISEPGYKDRYYFLITKNNFIIF